MTWTHSKTYLLFCFALFGAIFIFSNFANAIYRLCQGGGCFLPSGQNSNQQPGGGTIVISPTPTPCAPGLPCSSTPTPTPTATATPTPTPGNTIVLDLDIDSNNNNYSDLPERSQAEENIEEDLPGKILVRHAYDTDYDGVPDFADGIIDVRSLANATAYNGDRDTGTAGIELTPLIFSISGNSGADAKVIFSSPVLPSDPNEMTFIPGDPAVYSISNSGTITGYFRLWKKNGDAVRSAKSIKDGGDLIPFNDEIPLALLGNSSTLYLEGIVSTEADITATLIPGNDVEYDGAQSIFSDRVTFTVLDFEALDSQAFGPSWTQTGDSYGEGLLEFSSANFGLSYSQFLDSPSYPRVGGAITDGSSLIAAHFPGYWSYANYQQLFAKLSVRIDSVYNNAPPEADIPEVYGGFAQAVNSGGNAVVPNIPMPRYAPQSIGIHRKSALHDGGVWYIPPRNFMAEDSKHGGFYGAYAIAPSTAEEVAQMKFTIFYRNDEDRDPGHMVAQIPFRLRRPPLILVHGITAGPGPGNWPVSVWSENSLALATRVYHANYSATNVRGYDENIQSVHRVIMEALGEYRSATDNTATGGELYPHYIERSFRRVPYATTKADVVGHSMGGQITRAFISNVSGGFPRRGTWPGLYFNRTTAPYFESNNLGCGYIRRFIPLGSPFRGSPFSTALQDFLDPNSTRTQVLIEAAELDPNYIGETLVQQGILRRLAGGNFTSTYPTGYADLAENSSAQTLLERAQYPTNNKSVLWFPISTFAELNLNSDVMGSLTGNFFRLVPIIRQVFDIDFSIEHQRHLYPDVSDLVVPTYSQRNASIIQNSEDRLTLINGVGRNSNIGITLNAHTHSDWVLQNDVTGHYPGLRGQNNSEVVARKVGDLLSATDDMPERGVTPLGPNGGLLTSGLGSPE